MIEAGLIPRSSITSLDNTPRLSTVDIIYDKEKIAQIEKQLDEEEA